MNKAEITALTNIVNKNLDNIYTVSIEIGNQWSQKAIPLTVFKEIIDKSKPTIKTKDEQINQFNTKYCETLDAFYSGICKVSTKMNSKNIALSEIKNGVQLIKKSFKKGLNKKDNKSE